LNRVWYAPPAYYELGLIYGHTILRFKISRAGDISDLEVLRQVGHASLEQSSVSAIQAVFPFLPLPNNFPDEYLEVTVKMIYPNLREYNLSQSNE
jgi:TonB family protein